MKTRIPFKRIIAYIIIITIGILVLKLAPAIIYRYEVIVNGVLGLAIIYLLYRIYLSSRRVEIDEPIEVLLEFPKNIRFLIFGVFWSLVLYFALENIFVMILYLMNKLFFA